MKILVTGATGNVGREVVAQLLDAGADVGALARDPAAAGLPPGVELIRGDLGIPDSLTTALAGVSAVFLIWPLHTADSLPAVLESLRKNTGRVVFLGSGGVRDCTFEDQEQLLARSGLAWTLLVPSTFAANALWWTRQIRAGDEIRGAYGTLGMAMLHEKDIAGVAVRALLDGGHDGATYHLTGPEVLSQADQVRTIGAVIGRPLRWRELEPAEARKQLLADDFPESFVDVLLGAYAWMVRADPPELTDTVQRVTGQPARSFAAWVADHTTAFGAKH